MNSYNTFPITAKILCSHSSPTFSHKFFGVWISIVWLVFVSADGFGNPTVVVSGLGWKVDTALTPGWNALGFNDANWVAATTPVPVSSASPLALGSEGMWWQNTDVTDVYFRRTFTIPGVVTSANVEISADNEFKLYVNGSFAGTGANPFALFNIDITQFLQCGENVIAVHGIEYVPGTPSLLSLNATVNHTFASASAVNASLCEGQTYQLPSGNVVSAPGLYIDTVAAVGGCLSIINTTLTSIAVPLAASGDTTICLGSSTPLLASNASYYKWEPATGLNNPNISNPIATPLQTTSYVVKGYATGPNLVVNPDFESGNTGFGSSLTPQNPPNTFDGTFYIGTNPQIWNSIFQPCVDHTSGSGNMMMVNGLSAPMAVDQVFWDQMFDVQPGKDYLLSVWVQSLNALNPALLQFKVNGVALGPPFSAGSQTCLWKEVYQIWNSGSSTTAAVSITNQTMQTSGNDFAIDDISFRPVCSKSEAVLVRVSGSIPTSQNPEICSGTAYTLPSGNNVTISGTYVDTLVSSIGCDSIVVTNVKVLNCDTLSSNCIATDANVFTPNNDGINDFFSPLKDCAVESCELSIFNRWGQRVFFTQNSSEAWNGKNSDLECSQGVYYFLLTYKPVLQEERSMKGTLSLFR